MRSLSALFLCAVLAVFAFRADNQRVRTSVACRVHPELASSGACGTGTIAMAVPAPAPPETQAAPKNKPSKKKKRTRITRIVRATAYNAVPQQTDSTPEICAWGDKVRPGIIAISRDLEASGLTRGKEVYIEGIGKMVVMDRMNRRKRNQIDLYMEKYEDAVRFGVKELTISWTEDTQAEQES